MNNFRRSILKVSSPRKHKVRNSLGVYDAYKYIRKNKWMDIGRNLTEHEFYSIIRNVNNLIADCISQGKDVVLPHRMGRIELRKRKAKIRFKNGVLIDNLPIDWDKTLTLWATDEEAFKNRTLVKAEEKEIFRVYYNKSAACFNNKTFMEFEVNRDIKIRLKQLIKDKAIDAYELK